MSIILIANCLPLWRCHPRCTLANAPTPSSSLMRYSANTLPFLRAGAEGAAGDEAEAEAEVELEVEGVAAEAGGGPETEGRVEEEDTSFVRGLGVVAAACCDNARWRSPSRTDPSRPAPDSVTQRVVARPRASQALCHGDEEEAPHADRGWPPLVEDSSRRRGDEGRRVRGRGLSSRRRIGERSKSNFVIEIRFKQEACP